MKSKWDLYKPLSLCATRHAYLKVQPHQPTTAVYEEINLSLYYISRGHGDGLWKTTKPNMMTERKRCLQVNEQEKKIKNRPGVIKDKPLHLLPLPWAFNGFLK